MIDAKLNLQTIAKRGYYNNRDGLVKALKVLLIHLTKELFN